MTKNVKPAAPAKNVNAVPALKPVKSRSRHAGYVDEVRKMLSGNGLSIADLCAKLKLEDRAARGAIDAIRAKEGYDALPRVSKVFRYLGTDGKGIAAAK